ncbi:MAG: hypothetical protein HY862_14955 [Chloroflexi bacterium]|nr:hypothetical protein [Chloroflexota bacterium]
MQPPKQDREGTTDKGIVQNTLDRRIWLAKAYYRQGRIPPDEDSFLKTTWLPYSERFLLVTWLVLFTLIFQEQVLDMPASPLERIIIVIIGVWLTLLVMGIALRRSDYRDPVGYQARMRRRTITFFASTLWMVLLSLSFYFMMR